MRVPDGLRESICSWKGTEADTCPGSECYLLQILHNFRSDGDLAAEIRCCWMWTVLGWWSLGTVWTVQLVPLYSWQQLTPHNAGPEAQRNSSRGQCDFVALHTQVPVWSTTWRKLWFCGSVCLAVCLSEKVNLEQWSPCDRRGEKQESLMTCLAQVAIRISWLIILVHLNSTRK